ncbi:MAG: zinc ribbon domain-containing protein [Fidelibacterota bacterium]|nr:MAG: zinc ribbon domain-containing protein [Candidatus Neomarinimicrobiota bacterium]
MPIYDYRCRACGKVFAALVASSETPNHDVECPGCKEHRSERQLSMKTAVISGSSTRATGSTCNAPAGSGFS